ncbi:MAG: cell division protein ZapB [Pseudomonadota bacterium]
MVDLSNFEKLEGKIDNLVKQSALLKGENKVLLEKLDHKDQDIKILNDKIEELNKERTLVFDKVVDLIDKLEEI